MISRSGVGPYRASRAREGKFDWTGSAHKMRSGAGLGRAVRDGPL